MYNKLFTKILDSSIWMEPSPTRIVWLTFIAAMDETGMVQFASIHNVAHRAVVTLAEAEEAVRCLEAPDTNSSDPENEGRRIERVAGGWMVLNSAKYRSIATREHAKDLNRERVKKYRESKGVTGPCNAHVMVGNDSVTPSEAEADTKAEAKKTPMEASIEAVAFVEWFEGTIPERMRPKTKVDKQKWADAIDSLIKKEAASIPELKAVCQWARNHDFWSGNFYSLRKLAQKNKDGITFFSYFSHLMSSNGKKFQPTPPPLDPIIAFTNEFFACNCHTDNIQKLWNALTDGQRRVASKDIGKERIDLMEANRKGNV